MTGDIDTEVLAKVVEFHRRQAAEKEAAAAERNARFCVTPSAEAILGVLRTCMSHGYMGAVVGAPGVGKTSTLRWYAGDVAEAHYCVMNPSQSFMAAVLTLVCEALDMVAPMRAPQIHDVICNWARWQGQGHMLLIDEAQHLNDRCLDELRCIHDETGMAMVFAGNHSLRGRLADPRAAFAQFLSRVGPRVDLEYCLAADAAALAHHAGVRDPRAVAWLERQALGGVGGLRHVARLLTLARKEAGSGTVGVPHLQSAAVDLGHDPC